MTKTEMNIQDISDYIYRILPDPIFYQMRYFRKHRRFCNFKNPSYFSEKIYHRMRYPKPIFTVMADKVLVRDFIAEKVGEQYLVPVYFSCSKVSISTFDKLPKSFVMKANHSAGQVIIVVDKSQEDLSSLAKTANDWLATDFTDVAREKHYGCVRPQIIFEKALLNNGMSPDDYKVNVFNKLNTSESFLFIQHMSGRSDLLTQNLYLEDWAPAPFDRLGEEKGERSHVKPFFLDEMVKVSKDVSREFGYVRVDFYIHEERLYIGELTLTPAAGAYKFKPSEWDYKLGQMFGWPESV